LVGDGLAVVFVDMFVAGLMFEFDVDDDEVFDVEVEVFVVVTGGAVFVGAIVFVVVVVLVVVFVLVVLALLAASPQAIPNAPITRTAESAINFFII
jgi:hypothetical protein